MSYTQPSPTEELPCDFLAFLQERHGLSAPHALSTLGDLLLAYRPGPVAREKASAAFGATMPRRTPPARRRVPALDETCHELTTAA